MSEPTTAAGRALLDALLRLDANRPEIAAAAPIDWRPVVLAIEVEAVAAYRADLAAKVRGLPAGDPDWDLFTVLALIEGEPR